MAEKVITIEVPMEEYHALLERDLRLTALEGAGVDNWEGYDFAMQNLEEMKKEE